MSIKYEPPGRRERTRFERIHTVVFDDTKGAAREVAKELAGHIEASAERGEKFMLALEASPSLELVYRELVHLFQNGLTQTHLYFLGVKEYFPLEKRSKESCYNFLHEHLFAYLEIPEERLLLFDGECPAKDLVQYTTWYESQIKEIGRGEGIDALLAVPGDWGEIGFNQAGSSTNSVTRGVNLSHETRGRADFLAADTLVRRGITLGLETILQAKRVILLDHGSERGAIIQKMVEEESQPAISASFLQKHNNTTLVLDREAASELTQFRTPWLVGVEEWSEESICRAVVWLCEKTKTSILKLTDKDYNENGLSSLLESERTSAYDLNIRLFNRLHKTITGWPGGKPGVDDQERPERALPSPKRVILFSPHPDDDVISMGGTFDRLVQQGHEVHVAYQTSGNIAVSHDVALRFVEVGSQLDSSGKWESYLHDLNHGSYGQDSPETLRVKGLIRRSESLGATRFLDLPDEQVHFLDLPFYETGRIKKSPLGEKDITLVADLIEKVKPHQIYAAGDLADPHGTHRVCLDAIFMALDRLKERDFMRDCWVWLYRGAWHEWGIHEIEMAVPMSPDQVLRKRKAIFCHQSQKDGVMFQGNDAREFWVRAEARNKETALRYRQLGFADYAALEGFKRYYF